MNQKNVKLKRLKSAFNTISSNFIYQLIIEAILENNTPSGITFFPADNNPFKFSKVTTALFGVKYQPEAIKFSVMHSNNRSYPKGTLFCRSRKIDASKCEFKYSDFWEAPPEFTGRGRLNKENESMLYLSLEDRETAIIESRVLPGDTYMLMTYAAIDDIEVTEVGWDCNDEISSFLNSQFKKSGSAAYEISERLAKDVFQLSKDGWAYPSVLKEKGLNVCLNLESKNKIRLIGAFVHERTKRPIEDNKLGIFDLTNLDNIKLRDYSLSNVFKNSYAEIKLMNLYSQMNTLKDSLHKQSDKDLTPIFKTVIL